MRLITCLNLLRWLQSEGDYGNGCNPSFIMTVSRCLGKNLIRAPQRTLTSVPSHAGEHSAEASAPHSTPEHRTFPQGSRKGSPLKPALDLAVALGKGGPWGEGGLVFLVIRGPLTAPTGGATKTPPAWRE